MPKIKRKKVLGPKDFLKHLLEQEETEVALDGYTFNYNEKNYSFDPEITANKVISYDPYSGTYSVEVEEEIKWDTMLPSLLIKFEKNSDTFFATEEEASVNDVLETANVFYNATAKSINLINDDDTMTLLWRNGEMVE